MIIIRLKSGFELPITCEKFKFSTSGITGEITNYSIEGIEDNKPLFLRSEDIECIWRDMRFDEEKMRGDSDEDD